MGALSNNSATLAHYAGWYKSIQSAAAAIVWRLDGLKVSYMSMYISTFAILIGSVITTFYVAFTKVRDHSSDEMTVVVAEKAGDESLEEQSHDDVRVEAKADLFVTTSKV